MTAAKRKRRPTRPLHRTATAALLPSEIYTSSRAVAAGEWQNVGRRDARPASETATFTRYSGRNEGSLWSRTTEHGRNRHGPSPPQPQGVVTRSFAAGPLPRYRIGRLSRRSSDVEGPDRNSCSRSHRCQRPVLASPRYVPRPASGPSRALPDGCPRPYESRQLG